MSAEWTPRRGDEVELNGKDGVWVVEGPEDDDGFYWVFPKGTPMVPVFPRHGMVPVSPCAPEQEELVHLEEMRLIRTAEGQRARMNVSETRGDVPAPSFLAHRTCGCGELVVEVTNADSSATEFLDAVPDYAGEFRLTRGGDFPVAVPRPPRSHTCGNCDGINPRACPSNPERRARYRRHYCEYTLGAR